MTCLRSAQFHLPSSRFNIISATVEGATVQHTASDTTYTWADMHIGAGQSVSFSLVVAVEDDTINSAASHKSLAKAYYVDGDDDTRTVYGEQGLESFINGVSEVHLTSGASDGKALSIGVVAQR